MPSFNTSYYKRLIFSGFFFPISFDKNPILISREDVLKAVKLNTVEVLPDLRDVFRHDLG